MGGQVSRLEKHLPRTTVIMLLPVAMIIVFGLGSVIARIPVTTGTVAKNPQLEETFFKAEIQMYKPRQCLYVKDSEIGWYKADGVWYETYFEYLNDATPNSSHPTSMFSKDSFGYWYWVLPRGTIVTHVRTTVLHDCAGTLKVTIIGPIKI